MENFTKEDIAHVLNQWELEVRYPNFLRYPDSVREAMHFCLQLEKKCAAILQ